MRGIVTVGVCASETSAMPACDSISDSTNGIVDFRSGVEPKRSLRERDGMKSALRASTTTNTSFENNGFEKTGEQVISIFASCCCIRSGQLERNSATSDSLSMRSSVEKKADPNSRIPAMFTTMAANVGQ